MQICLRIPTHPQICLFCKFFPRIWTHPPLFANFLHFCTFLWVLVPTHPKKFALFRLFSGNFFTFFKIFKNLKFFRKTFLFLKKAWIHFVLWERYTKFNKGLCKVFLKFFLRTSTDLQKPSWKPWFFGLSQSQGVQYPLQSPNTCLLYTSPSPRD